jgi:hypothetical protein
MALAKSAPVAQLKMRVYKASENKWVNGGIVKFPAKMARILARLMKGT